MKHMPRIEGMDIGWSLEWIFASPAQQ